MHLTTGRWTIRPAVGQDQATLADIYMTVRRATFTWIDPGRFHIEDFAEQSRGESIWVCEDREARIGGFISISDPEAFIHMLFIRPECQGSGAGTALIEALPGWPRRRYRLKCLLKNTRARRFYESIGFVVTGQGLSTEGPYNDMLLGPATGRQR